MQFTLKQLMLVVTWCAVAMALTVGGGVVGAILAFLLLEVSLLVASRWTKNAMYVIVGAWLMCAAVFLMGLAMLIPALSIRH